MNFLNTCILEGHLTGDAERKSSKNGGVVTVFSIAQNRNYINSKNELVRETSFFNVEAWGEGFANKTSKFLTKGTPVRVIGRLKMDYWMDESGKRREKAVLNCEKFDFLPSLQSDKNKKLSTGEAYNEESENISVEDVDCIEEVQNKETDSQPLPKSRKKAAC